MLTQEDAVKAFLSREKVIVVDGGRKATYPIKDYLGKTGVVVGVERSLTTQKIEVFVHFDGLGPGAGFDRIDAYFLDLLARQTADKQAAERDMFAGLSESLAARSAEGVRVWAMYPGTNDWHPARLVGFSKSTGYVVLWDYTLFGSGDVHTIAANWAHGRVKLMHPEDEPTKKG